MTEREREAVEQALEYLRRDPPSLSLAIGCLKAALEPDAPRWGDMRLRHADGSTYMDVGDYFEQRHG